MNFFYKSKTFSKMLISITIVCLCFYCIGLLSNVYSRFILSKQIRDTLDSKATFWEKQIDQQVMSLLLAQSSLSGDKELLELYVMWDNMSNYQRSYEIKQFSNRLLNIKILHNITESIKTYFPDRKMVISAGSPILDYYENDEFFHYDQIYISDNGKIYLTTYFPLKMNQEARKKPTYYIRTEISRETLHDMLSEMLGEDEGNIYLLDNKGRLLSSTEKQQERYRKEEGVLLKVKNKISNGQSDSFHIEDHEYAFSCYYSSLGFWIVYNYPVQILKEPLDFFNLFNIILTLLLIIMFSSYTVYARRAFAEPLNRILQAMEDSGNKDKEPFLIEDKKKDELSVIYHRYNKMVKRTENLIRENLETKYRAHIAELRQLQYQIQPHFLYNSIFLIYRMAQMDERDDIADYAKSLGSYYQYITRISDQKVQVIQEIQHIRNYLAIQETRFGSRISVGMGPVPEEVEKMDIVPLILQPLVENAYEHGLKNVMKDGEIKISMIYENSIFTFSVEDNGEGMTEKQLEKVRNCMQKKRIDTEEIHGLANTNMRLKLNYGEKSGLIFANREGGGFQVNAVIYMKGETDV